MAIYDSRDFKKKDLEHRFPSRAGIFGVKQWVRLIARMRDLASQAETPDGLKAIFREFDRFLRAVAAIKAPLATPRVFVSHQRTDSKKAERVAWHATEVGFEYWLDVHDPVLAFANRSTRPPPIKAVLIAAIIEMGLLNSSHVVALQTAKSQRSRWVPYEFGRAKQRLLMSLNAASWFETGITPDLKGDYLSLACCALTKLQLEQWFTSQPGACRVSPNRLWPKTYIPNPLPN